MNITYREERDLEPSQLQQLFASVHWESAAYPNRLAEAMHNSSRVITAWDGDLLIGLIRSLDDGADACFIHYLLVNPKYQGHHVGHALMERLMACYQDYLYIKVMPSDPQAVPFYQQFGFRRESRYTAMQIDRMGQLKDHAA